MALQMVKLYPKERNPHDHDAFVYQHRIPKKNTWRRRREPMTSMVT